MRQMFIVEPGGPEKLQMRESRDKCFPLAQAGDSREDRGRSNYHRTPKMMSRLTTFTIFVLMSAGISLKAQQAFQSEHDNLRNQQKAIEQANAALDEVYQRVLASLDARIRTGDVISKKVKDSLIAAERAWIKWRDAEAAFRAYRDAVGGSAYLEDLNANLMQLINERKEFLKRWPAQ